jgi:hypothetical protein
MYIHQDDIRLVGGYILERLLGGGLGSGASKPVGTPNQDGKALPHQFVIFDNRN